MLPVESKLSMNKLRKYKERAYKLWALKNLPDLREREREHFRVMHEPELVSVCIQNLRIRRKRCEVS